MASNQKLGDVHDGLKQFKRRRRRNSNVAGLELDLGLGAHGGVPSKRASMEKVPGVPTTNAALPKLEAFAFGPTVPSSSNTVLGHAQADTEGEEEEDGENASGVVTLVRAHTEALPSPNDEEDGDDDTPHELKLGQIIPGACDTLVAVTHELVAALEGLTFKPPVTCVYNPLVYARNLHEQYIRRHGGRKVEVLLIGMNPGPFGMAQVESPLLPHPRRPIYGLECSRHEISGQRLWGWARDRFGSAAAFFKHFWVYNYCPLVFMEASGKNRTPDKLHPAERTNLEIPCNEALIKTISILRPVFVIGVGKYAASKIQQCICNIPGVKFGDIMHPSPANPQANKDWSQKIEAQLTELGVTFKT